MIEFYITFGAFFGVTIGLVFGSMLFREWRLRQSKEWLNAKIANKKRKAEMVIISSKHDCGRYIAFVKAPGYYAQKVYSWASDASAAIPGMRREYFEFLEIIDKSVDRSPFEELEQILDDMGVEEIG